MRLVGAAPKLAEPAGPLLASDDLLRGYRADLGQGARYSVGQMETRDWRAPEHGVWPARARASSSFGGGWSAKAIVGRPTVYPRSGDRRGAWAPRACTSHVEWIEAEYPEGVGAARALRVFETHVVGSSFAVTVTGADGREEVVWQRPPQASPGTGARVLEVPLSPPRVVRRARVYLGNSGRRWSEIDTIGLLAVDPVPEPIRATFKRHRSRRGWSILGLCLLCLLALWGLGRFASCSSVGRPAEPPAPRLSLQDTGVRDWPVSASELALARLQWASGAAVVSSQYGLSRWAATQATGAPDTYPVHADRPTAWAAQAPDGGSEWIELVWPEAVPARQIVVVESFNPGALARIDDLSGAEPVTLWQGHGLHAAASRVLVFELAEPRPITRLRLVLDTTRARGWNEIDAVGLRPALP